MTTTTTKTPAPDPKPAASCYSAWHRQTVRPADDGTPGIRRSGQVVRLGVFATEAEARACIGAASRSPGEYFVLAGAGEPDFAERLVASVIKHGPA